jgi:hypothetical protein
MIPYSEETTVTAVPSEDGEATWNVVIAKPGLLATTLYNFTSEVTAQKWIDEHAWKWTPTAPKAAPTATFKNTEGRIQSLFKRWLRLPFLAPTSGGASTPPTVG